jgi:DNA-binding HxlR family transcriptional regulator
MKMLLSTKIVRLMWSPLATEELFSQRPETILNDLFDTPNELFNKQRLAIMLELYCAGGVDFPQLKRDIRGITDGALASHLKTLTDTELVAPRIERVGSRERTTYIITKKGVISVENLFKNLDGIREELGIRVKEE